MRNVLATAALVCALSFSQAQTFTSSERTKCQVQVAFAISEGEGFGEYSITELISIAPGKSHDFRNQEFDMRQIYSRVAYDEMFIVRFPTTGITHFLDATVPDGFETALIGGCSMDQRPFYSHDGEFIIEASSN